MSSLEKAKNFCQRFKRAQRGTTAIIFGIMVIPLLAFTGGVVDYGRAVKTKSQLVATLDAAVLAAMMQYSLDESTDYKQVIRNYVKKNLAEADKSYQGLEVNIEVPDITEDGEMKASIGTKVKTNFLLLVGFDEFDINVASASMVGGNSVEVVLVLDNTGSMKGSKLTALKGAANELVDTVMKNGGEDRVKFAIVPFADYVNIGNTGETDGSGQPVLVNRDMSGLDIPSDYSFTPPGQNCKDTYPTSTRQCTNNPSMGVCDNDGVSYPCMRNHWTCTGDRGDAVEVCEPHEEIDYKWHGCVGSRLPDLNVKDEDYDTGVPGIMYEWSDWCNEISMITPLTSEKSQITDGIEAMIADDRKTYIPSGLSWGWRVLSSAAPFTQGTPEGDDSVRKVIVLMTDGANTRSAYKWTDRHLDSDADEADWKKRLSWRARNNNSEVWGHNSWNGDAANPVTAQLCTNIKEKKIMVYTIGFEIAEGSDVENLMIACAGNGGKYYDADNEAELADAFKEIGMSLLNLRLSQ